MTQDEKLDAVHAMTLEIRPLLPLITKRLDDQDNRQRAADKSLAEHEVKIERLKEDVDGLGKKIRRAGESGALRPQAAGGDWHSFVSLVSELPSYWHFFATGATGAALIAGAVWKLKHFFGG